MVAGLLTRYIETAHLADQLLVKSAGTGAAPDIAASAHSVTALARKGIDISAHRSQRLSYDLIQELTSYNIENLDFYLCQAHYWSLRKFHKKAIFFYKKSITWK